MVTYSEVTISNENSPKIWTSFLCKVNFFPPNFTFEFWKIKIWLCNGGFPKNLSHPQNHGWSSSNFALKPNIKKNSFCSYFFNYKIQITKDQFPKILKDFGRELWNIATIFMNYCFSFSEFIFFKDFVQKNHVFKRKKKSIYKKQ